VTAARELAPWFEEADVAGDSTAQGERVVVGVDGSNSSRLALEWAANQAHRTGARLRVVAAWDWPASYGWTVPIPADYNPEADSRSMVIGLVEEVQKIHTDLPVEWSTIQGHPAPVLIEVSKDADLLVVGSRGHGEFAGMLLGSVSEHCAAAGHCTVVVVRGEPQAATAG
jgi:nucleotide-binding universal stress UspA family protein